ncbi:hypothetical protein LAZ67_16001165 [Cordylochernes scorpioides]|uniref:HTH CENPB-type domain-containing protein n=1 Tax=Cordylochernes scorpioides TaxID=51811 RepID=A0ABY6LDU9_9ARAC|nr:hypothetical protein LAZ67_16001165 [Cordylochernes scorpioides]
MKDILGVGSLNAVFVPKDLTFDQKNARKETASLNLEATTDDPELLKRVITGEETWIYGFDSETTQKASEWRFKNEPRPKKARKAPRKVKVMLTVFFDYQGIIHHKFQQQGSTITADSYLGVLRRLREAIRQKRPELWKSKSWILHHDNAPAHTALKISKFLQDHSTSVFPQPRSGPLRLLPLWKAQKKLKGRKFQSIEEIKVESKNAMKAIPKTDYQSSTLKRDRGGEFPEIEEALFRWIRQANAMKLAINGNILKEKAILLALKMGQDNFEASNGWLEKFKARRNIAFKRLHGEAGSVDANSVATWKGFVMDEAMEEVVEEEMNRCFEALKKHQAIDVNYIDFLEVDKDVQVAGEQSIEEIVKEVMGKEEDEENEIIS